MLCEFVYRKEDISHNALIDRRISTSIDSIVLKKQELQEWINVVPASEIDEPMSPLMLAA